MLVNFLLCKMQFPSNGYLGILYWLIYSQIVSAQHNATTNKMTRALFYKELDKRLKDPLNLTFTRKLENKNKAILELKNSNSEKSTFRMPLDMLSETNKTFNTFRNFSEAWSFNLSQNFYSLSEIDIDREMKIYSVDLEGHQSLVALFYDFNKEHSFDVVIREHNLPNLRHFSENRTISTSPVEQITYTNKNQHVVRLHIGVLPSQKMFQQTSIKDHDQNQKSDKRQFNLSVIFMVASCVYQNETTSMWNSVCETGQYTPSVIVSCQCYEISNKPKVFLINPLVIFRPTEKLTRFASHSNGMLSIFLIVILLLYMVALVFGLGQIKNEVYYLADNLWCDRYAYLIKVKTGFARSAGTTSNISIKLKGAQHLKSKSHVLNFPDPESILLQRQNDDYFLLTTEKHLGELQSILLWHDSVGFSPTWECDHITVFDLQNLDRYIFRVHKNFRVTQKSSNFFIARVSERKTGTEVKKHSEHFTVELSGLTLSWYKNATISISSILMTFMIEMSISSYPSWDPLQIFTNYSQNGFQNIYLDSIIFGTIITILCHLSFAYLFRNSAGQFHDRKVVITQYSFRVTVLTWILLGCSLMVSISYMIYIDIWIPNISHYFWVSSIAVSFVVQFSIYLKTYGMLRPCFNACSKRTTKEMAISTILDQIESQRDYIHTRFGGMGLRPYLTHLYTPIPEKNISSKKLHDEILVQIIELIEDGVMVIVYLIILHFILFIDRQELGTYATVYVKELLGGSGGRSGEHHAMSNSDFYDYFNHTFIEVIFPPEWYSDNAIMSRNIIDNLNTIITVPRIRQVRIKSDFCEPYYHMKYLKAECIREFDVAYEDTLSYLPEWQEATVHKSTAAMWKHTVPILTGDIHYEGFFAEYPGGGYVAEFVPERESVIDMLIYLRETSWINIQTKLLVVNLLLYNVNANSFIMVALKIEKGATGLFIVRRYVTSKQWLFVNHEMKSAFMQIFAIAVLWLAFLVFKKMTGLMRSLSTFFKDIWNAIDLTLIIMSLICVTLMMLRLEMLEDFISRLLAVNLNKYIAYDYLTRLEEILLIISLMVIVCAAVRLWKLLRFGRVFRIMETTLFMAAAPLFCGLLCHFVITVAFSILGLTVIGPYSTTFKGTMGNTITELLLLSVNLTESFDYRSLTVAPYALGYVFLTAFLISMLTLYNIYKTIVIMSYSKAKQYFSNELAFEYTTKDYIKDNFNILFKKKARLKGGGPIKEKVYPKADEFRFANGYFVATYEMVTLQYLVLCFLRNRFRLNNEESVINENYDDLLMERTVDHVFGKKVAWDTKELFFKGQMIGQNFAFIDEARIIQMESVVNVMLLTADEKNILYDKERFYKKKLEQNGKHLDYMLSSLKDMLKILNNVEVGMPQF